jgi:hypothetical protein
MRVRGLFRCPAKSAIYPRFSPFRTFDLCQNGSQSKNCLENASHSRQNGPRRKSACKKEPKPSAYAEHYLGGVLRRAGDGAVLLENIRLCRQCGRPGPATTPFLEGRALV